MSSTTHARTEHHVRLDRHVAAEFGVGAKKHRLGRDHRNAGFHRGVAQPPLHHILGLGELRLAVDPAHLILRGFQRHRFQRHAVGDRHRVGQIEFALGVVVSDAIEDFERDFAAQRHQPAVAQIDLALEVARVPLLADGHQAVPVHHEAAVAGRIGGPETQHRDACMMIDRATQPLERIGADQRRVAEDHQDIVGALRDGRARGQHRIGGAAPLGLNENLRLGQRAPRFIRDSIRPGPTTTAAASVPAPRTAASTCASIERPAIGCSTFGNAERMRVPSPAASTIARQVRLLIGNPGAVCWRRHTGAKSLRKGA